MSTVDYHSFMCIKCGKMVYSLPRKLSRQYKRGHMKKLYCPYCKLEINCVECFDDNDIVNFKIKFNNGEYEEEKNKSLDFLKGDD